MMSYKMKPKISNSLSLPGLYPTVDRKNMLADSHLIFQWEGGQFHPDSESISFFPLKIFLLTSE